MTAINQLGNLSLADVQSSDLLKIYSQRYGGEAALSLSILASYVLAQASTTPSGIDLLTQYAAPSATGFTATVGVSNTWLVLTPAAAYATGTIALPVADHGDEVLVNSTQAVTTLTVSAQPGDSVVGAPTTLAANGFFRLRYDEVLNRYYRVG